MRDVSFHSIVYIEHSKKVLFATALYEFPLKTLCFSFIFACVSFMYIINISKERSNDGEEKFTSKDIKFGSIIKCVLYEICFCLCTKFFDSKYFI